MSDNERSQTGEFSTFYLGGELFGIDILDIHEINKQFETTRIPDVPDEIEGILNLRGQIVTVFDLGKKLGLHDNKSEAKERRNIVVDSKGEYIGLIVDKMGDVISAERSRLEPVPANLGGIQGRFFHGILKTDNKLVGILNIDEILKEKE